MSVGGMLTTPLRTIHLQPANQTTVMMQYAVKEPIESLLKLTSHARWTLDRSEFKESNK